MNDLPAEQHFDTITVVCHGGPLCGSTRKLVCPTVGPMPSPLPTEPSYLFAGVIALQPGGPKQPVYSYQYEHQGKRRECRVRHGQGEGGRGCPSRGRPRPPTG